MRKFLSTIGIARLSGYSRAQIWNKARSGQIPAQRVKCEKRYRYIDEPVIRAWCKRPRWDEDERFCDIIKATRNEIMLRDYLPHLEGLIHQELRSQMRRQLHESDDPDELLKKWKRATSQEWVDYLGCAGRVLLARLSNDVVEEIARRLLDSKDPGQLLKNWAQAIAERRPQDLPRVL
jgi:hypothetical protein